MKKLYQFFIDLEVISKENREDIVSSFFEEMVVGNLGFTGSSSPEGPVAGIDPVMNRYIRKRKSKKDMGKT